MGCFCWILLLQRQMTLAVHFDSKSLHSKTCIYFISRICLYSHRLCRLCLDTPKYEMVLTKNQPRCHRWLNKSPFRLHDVKFSSGEKVIA